MVPEEDLSTKGGKGKGKGKGKGGRGRGAPWGKGKGKGYYGGYGAFYRAPSYRGRGYRPY